MAITPVTGTTQPTASETSKAKLTGDLSSFLTLLTTQLKHQDPLEPVDSTEFTSQLAQFAEVEQNIQTNANLEKLIGLSLANQSLTAVSYLGKYVEAVGNTATLANGSASFAYSLPQIADGVAIQIKNEAGVTVAVKPGVTSAGKHDFVWDGKDSQGLALPDGKYTISVAAATADGEAIPVETYTVGVVDSADSSSGSIQISINGVSVPIEDVITVKPSPPTI
jgi:flagellar basal-body rod modification protein FlgD